MDFDRKRSWYFAPYLVCAILVVATTVQAGLGIGGRRSVGGVSIDADGIVRSATMDEQRELASLVQQGLEPVRGDLGKASKMRMISLKGLQKVMETSQSSGAMVADEVEFLAGLQRIEYVFVDQESDDIIIAGPAEPWQLKDDGSVVGAKSGGATMRLADLMVALSTVEESRKAGISCSIEPTPEGRRRLKQFLSRVKLRPGQNPAMLESAMKEAFGPQMIHLTGVPTDSRYARTLVAADFEMKRVAMGLRDSPVTSLPSYLQMSKNSAHASNQNPRWWMACQYDPLTRSQDGMAWKISGQGVKTMTEQDIVAKDGSAESAGRADKLAQVWADKMTESFESLAKELPIFGDLRNIMDATVVATLISQQQLDQKAGIDLSVLRGEADSVELASYAIPKAVDPQCSFIRGRKGWVVTASGGVDINAFEVVQNETVDQSMDGTRSLALESSSADRWWWDK